MYLIVLSLPSLGIEPGTFRGDFHLFCFTLLLTLEILDLGESDSNNHSSLLFHRINYGSKKFYSTGCVLTKLRKNDIVITSFVNLLFSKLFFTKYSFGRT
jgi:hypothetical protein